MLLAIERAMGMNQPAAKVSFRIIYIVFRTAVVFVAVSFAWLLFRFVHFEDMIRYVSGMSNLSLSCFSSEIYLGAVLCALPVVLQHFLQDEFRNSKIQPFVYGGMLALAIFARGPDTTFIYFRF